MQAFSRTSSKQRDHYLDFCLAPCSTRSPRRPSPRSASRGRFSRSITRVSSPPLYVRSSSSSSSTRSPSQPSPLRKTTQPTSIEKLPCHILVDIFLASVEDNPEDGHRGGLLAQWDSNEELARLREVCLAWDEAATCALYRSVALLGGTSARHFLRTIASSPVARKVQSLVIGVGYNTEGSDDPIGLLHDSLDLVRCLEACENVKDVQIRPLHHEVHPMLTSVLERKERLSVLVVGPRTAPWHQQRWSASRVLQALPKLKTLELEAEMTPIGDEEMEENHTPSTLGSLSLVQLRLDIYVCDEELWTVLAACPQLEVLEIYLERGLRIERTARALMDCASSLEHLQLLSNPTSLALDVATVPSPRLFDALVPQLTSLVTFNVTATELSPSSIPYLPSTLTSLDLHSFNSHGSLGLAHGLLEALLLRSSSVGESELRTITVHDEFEEEDGWDRAMMAAIQMAGWLGRVEVVFEAMGIDAMEVDEEV